MLSYSQRVHELKTALAARDRRCEELIGELEIVIHRGEEEACKARQTLAAQEQEWMQRVTDWQRRAAGQLIHTHTHTHICTQSYMKCDCKRHAYAHARARAQDCNGE